MSTDFRDEIRAILKCSFFFPTMNPSFMQIGCYMKDMRQRSPGGANLYRTNLELDTS